MEVSKKRGRPKRVTGRDVVDALDIVHTNAAVTRSRTLATRKSGTSTSASANDTHVSPANARISSVVPEKEQKRPVQRTKQPAKTKESTSTTSRTTSSSVSSSSKATKSKIPAQPSSSSNGGKALGSPLSHGDGDVLDVKSNLKPTIAQTATIIPSTSTATVPSNNPALNQQSRSSFAAPTELDPTTTPTTSLHSSPTDHSPAQPTMPTATNSRRPVSTQNYIWSIPRPSQPPFAPLDKASRFISLDRHPRPSNPTTPSPSPPNPGPGFASPRPPREPASKPTEMPYEQLRKDPRFKALSSRYTRLIISLPVLIVTSWALWQRSKFCVLFLANRSLPLATKFFWLGGVKCVLLTVCV